MEITVTQWSQSKCKIAVIVSIQEGKSLIYDFQQWRLFSGKINGIRVFDSKDPHNRKPRRTQRSKLPVNTVVKKFKEELGFDSLQDAVRWIRSQVPSYSHIKEKTDQARAKVAEIKKSTEGVDIVIEEIKLPEPSLDEIINKEKETATVKNCEDDPLGLAFKARKYESEVKRFCWALTQICDDKGYIKDEFAIDQGRFSKTVTSILGRDWNTVQPMINTLRKRNVIISKPKTKIQVDMDRCRKQFKNTETFEPLKIDRVLKKKSNMAACTMQKEIDPKAFNQAVTEATTNDFSKILNNALEASEAEIKKVEEEFNELSKKVAKAVSKKEALTKMIEAIKANQKILEDV